MGKDFKSSFSYSATDIPDFSARITFRLVNAVDAYSSRIDDIDQDVVPVTSLASILLMSTTPMRMVLDRIRLSKQSRTEELVELTILPLPLSSRCMEGSTARMVQM